MRGLADDGIEGSDIESVTPTAPAAPRWKRYARAMRDWMKSLAIALLLFVVVRTFLVEAFRIPTRSMENTLLAGDFLLSVSRGAATSSSSRRLMSPTVTT